MLPTAEPGDLPQRRSQGLGQEARRKENTQLASRKGEERVGTSQH